MAFLNTELKHYNTKMKSITAFLQSQRRPFSQMVKEQNSATNHNHDDLERAFELNRVWNENVAKQRAARLTAEALAVQAIKDSKLAENIKRLEKEQTRAKELLQSVAERRTQALDMDNLDEELEKFLDSEPINHNFAITATGEKIR
ncbi:hypothetical protein EB796_006557 [Bugula neritina]|uniref:Uncharacterized protein n=1 Tax=Bugula neritina TaxID=10212 RepID=A0A7J7KB20_BUGNE|nr:hypothetical protein EB796_006557 [Bugula neritina]